VTDILTEAAARCSFWLFDVALPLWADRGVDEAGLFHEKLDFDGRPDEGANRRMRVQARQLYVFNQAKLMGWPVPAPILERGLDNFVRLCWATDGEPGWIHLLGPDGKPRHAKRDLYDHAFALFALAYVFRNTGDPAVRRLADETLAFLDGAMCGPGGGFLEVLPGDGGPRRANPHMHLLEAMLAWHEATGESLFLDRANAIIDLFQTRFFDPATGTLGEYFTDDWAIAPGVDGTVVEPGHHFEWTWLLVRAAEAGGRDARAEAARLYHFGLAHGLDDTGLGIDECDRTGRQVKRSRRAWPQTELIKAYIAMGEGAKAASVANRFFDTYLATAIGGLWTDHFDERGGIIGAGVPASTFYHVMVAFRELIDFSRQPASLAKRTDRG
jgi:mannose-6-phosphate isomerase